MTLNREDTFPMEIRVIIDLPEDVFDEYSDLKRKRKLTNRVQEAIISHEKGDKKEVANSYSGERMDRLEETVLQMSLMVNKLVENSNSDREERQQEFEKMKKQMERQEEVVSSLSNELTNLKSLTSNVKPLTVHFQKENFVETSEIKSVEAPAGEKEEGVLVISDPSNIDEQRALLKKQLEELDKQGTEVQKESVRKAPSKSVLKKISSMMDI